MAAKTSKDIINSTTAMVISHTRVERFIIGLMYFLILKQVIEHFVEQSNE